MNQEKLKLVIQNVLRTDDGYLLLKHLIEESGCLNREASFDTLKHYYFLGRKGFGDYILELVRKCDFKSYTKIQEERK